MDSGCWKEDGSIIKRYFDDLELAPTSRNLSWETESEEEMINIHVQTTERRYPTRERQPPARLKLSMKGLSHGET